jgi:hypothetical protein
MMHQHPCTEVRDRLEAYHDGELTIDDRVAIQQHLGDCVSCNLAAIELAEMSRGFRDLASYVAEHDETDPSRLSAQVVERLRVEESFSIRAKMTDLFSDMHLVWAGLGATMAMMICVVGSASVLHAANQERPNSMARTISVLASPGSNDNPLRLDYSMLVPGRSEAPAFGLAPRAISDELFGLAEEDAEYALSAVVSREGRVQGVAFLDTPPARGVNAMLNEAYRMQFVPAIDRGDAVAVSVVWLVLNTTVKGHHDEDMRALRRALRVSTTPAPLAPLPVPVEITQPKLEPPSIKPMDPEPGLALAATEGLF